MCVSCYISLVDDTGILNTDKGIGNVFQTGVCILNIAVGFVYFVCCVNVKLPSVFLNKADLLCGNPVMTTADPEFKKTVVFIVCLHTGMKQSGNIRLIKGLFYYRKRMGIDRPEKKIRGLYGVRDIDQKKFFFSFRDVHKYFFHNQKIFIC